MKFKSVFFLVIILLLTIISCNNYTPEELEYIKSIENQRAENDEWMKNDPNSPFNYKGKVEFTGLKHFDIDPSFVFKSNVIVYDDQNVIPIFGTKGEERAAVRYGYLPFKKDGKEYKLNLYANISKDSTVYYSLWFTDKTTNKETYGVGRYISFILDENFDHVYTIDFNLAFNPYCAYSSEYSCAVPTKEDYIDLAITAGEKKYHD